MASVSPPAVEPPVGTEVAAGPTVLEALGEKRSSRAAWLPLIVGIVVALPVVVAPFPPMTDLPHHEALVAVLRTMGDTSKFPPGFYVTNFGHPNQLFHLLAWPLSYVVSPTLASKLVAALGVASIPWGTGRLARHLGVSLAVSLLAVPIALGWIFNWGFVNNLLGLGLLLALLPELDRFVKKPTWRGFAISAAAMLLLYLAHELMMFVLVGACGIFTLLWPGGLRDRAFRLAPAVFGLGVAAVQVVLQEHLKTATVSGIRNVFIGPWHKIVGMPMVLVGGPAAFSKYAVFGLCLLAAGLFARLHRPDWASVTERGPLALRLASVRFVILAVAVFGLYMVAPFSFNGAMLVHHRFLAPAVLIGLVAVSAGPLTDTAETTSSSERRPSTLALAIATVVPVAMLLVVWPDFVDSSDNYVAVGKLLDQIPPRSSVAAIDVDEDQAGRVFSVASAQSRVLERSGGRVLYSFTDSPVSPVRMAPAYQWDEPAARVMMDNLAFRPAHDLTRFRFLLVHASRLIDVELTGSALSPFAALVDVSGEWALYQSRFDVVPLTSPDVPLPTPHPHTLRYLRNQVLEAIKKARPAVPGQPL